MKKICKAASLASLCVSLAGNVCAQQSLPLYGIDWLGMLMWGVVGLCVVFVCTYGEHYDWFDSFHIRFATFIGVITFILNRWRASFIHHSYIFYDLFSRYPMVLMLIGIIVLGDTLLAPEHIFEHALMEGILLLIAIGAWLFAALFHPAIRPTRYLHPLFTTIRSNLSMDMLKKMRAEKRTEME